MTANSVWPADLRERAAPWTAAPQFDWLLVQVGCKSTVPFLWQVGGPSCELGTQHDAARAS